MRVPTWLIAGGLVLILLMGVANLVGEGRRRSEMIEQGICKPTGETRSADRGAMQCMGWNAQGGCTVSIWISNWVEEHRYVCPQEQFWR